MYFMENWREDISKIYEWRVIDVFTEKEKCFMRECGLNLDFDNLSDDDYVEIEEVIGNKLTLECLDDNYNPNEDGLLCEEILDKLR